MNVPEETKKTSTLEPIEILQDLNYLHYLCVLNCDKICQTIEDSEPNPSISVARFRKVLEKISADQVVAKKP